MPTFFPMNPVTFVPAAVQLDLDVDTRRQVELAERVDRLLCRLEDVEQPFVRADLELLARLLVDVRRAVHREAFDARGKRHRARNASARALHCIYDLAH